MIIPGLAVLMVLALTHGDVHMAAGRLGELAVVLVLGAVPFCALGLVIGLMFDVAALAAWTVGLGLIVAWRWRNESTTA